MEKYIVWHIEGGLGKNVAATALTESIKFKYPDRKIIIVASYPDVFINDPHIYRVYKIGMTSYFYEDYIKDKDTIIFRHEPYFETNHILKRKHLIENWCSLLDLEYDSQTPNIHFNLVQQRNASKWKSDLPIMLIQTNGGPFQSDNHYSWTRDIPFDLSLKIAERYSNSYRIIQVCKPSSYKIPGAQVIDYLMEPMELFSILILSEKRVLIDSSLQHAAAALKLPSTVLWIGTSPNIFGYSIHNNITANPPSDQVKLHNSYLFDYSFEGNPRECPYFSINDMFDVKSLIENIYRIT
jgi:hypothetical protein